MAIIWQKQEGCICPADLVGTGRHPENCCFSGILMKSCVLRRKLSSGVCVACCPTAVALMFFSLLSKSCLKAALDQILTALMSLG